MAITIELYERTGPAGSPVDTLVTNMNWKSHSLNDNLYKYYYYPIRLPETSPTNQSVPKYLYAKISGTYASARRVRWKLSGQADVGTRVLVGTSATYTTPQANLSLTGILSTLPEDNKPIYVIPRLSLTSPTSSPTFTPELASNTTYYTDFLVTQFLIDSRATAVGNSNEYTVILTLDEYE